jgi:hypothetical protein
MSDSPDYTLATHACPKIVRYCKTCEKETPHEIRNGVRVAVTICIPCLERALNYEMD